MSEQTSPASNVTATAAPSVWRYPNVVVVVTTVLTSAVSLLGLGLNGLLVMTIKCSPSLKTPPNSHLLNICFNNLLLALHALVSLPCLHLNGVHVPVRSSEVLSGIQLFLVMHCLLQYWGAFVSIGYYRFKTLHHPLLSLRVRKLVVSRSIATTWLISLLLAVTFSLTSAPSSAYLPCSLDPFRSSFYRSFHEAGEGEEVKEEGTESEKEEKKLELWHQSSEQMVVMALVVGALLLGLAVILLSYYSICRTLNVRGRSGKCRVSPWPRHSSTSLPTLPLSEPASGVEGAVEINSAVPSGGRSYRPDPGSEIFCVNGHETEVSEAKWVVHYQRLDHNVFVHDLLAMDKPGHSVPERSASIKRTAYGSKRPLAATLSSGSTTSSTRTSNAMCPDFTDISLSGDIARQQKLQCRSALKKQTVRRERGSLSSASKNSLVMLTIFLLCSLPLIIGQIPGSLARLSPQRRMVVLLTCRLLFLLNCPVYPLWYLLFSIRVKQCLKRMLENFSARLHYQPQ